MVWLLVPNSSYMKYKVIGEKGGCIGTIPNMRTIERETYTNADNVADWLKREKEEENTKISYFSIKKKKKKRKKVK